MEKMLKFVLLLGLLSVSSAVSLSPTNDYDDEGLCVWGCSGHGDCYIDDGEKLPSCHCEVNCFFVFFSFRALISVYPKQNKP